MTPTTQPRVAAISVFTETNTFSPIRTDMTAFSRRWMLGDAWSDAFDGTRTVGGGFIEGCVDAGLELVPIFGAFAVPAGLVTAEAANAILDAILRGLEHIVPVDGVLLELHGAHVAESFEDFEDTIVERIRAVVGSAPIAVVTDMHANLGTQRLMGADILVGYRTNPHIDTYEAGWEAARLLGATLAGEFRPVRVHRGLPLVVIPPAQGTRRAPLDEIWRRADELQIEHGLANVTVHGGYAYADVPWIGMGVSVTVDEDRRDAAVEAAEELIALIEFRAQSFKVALPSAEQAFEDAARGPSPVVIADTGDNIGGGAPGDSTRLLGIALEDGRGLSTLSAICDPASVAVLESAEIGSRSKVVLGAFSSQTAGVPLELDVTVVSVHDGNFINRGPMSTGASVTIGRAVVVTVDRHSIVVHEKPLQPNDPQFFRSVGLEPSGFDIVLLKGAAAIRAGWTTLASRFVDASTMGVCDSVLERLHYENAPTGCTFIGATPLTPNAAGSS